ncbi:hypothetical protein GE061_006438 [Apolygus lucorum]|uniref:Uncharacterized protein n=1 Tax=Apolygus lucorum TaxID=248454 RepID=A0A8S9WTY6_APOLU|nr:hypothetical protein GE061_006438 [Apolygus lucorum]
MAPEFIFHTDHCGSYKRGGAEGVVYALSMQKAPSLRLKEGEEVQRVLYDTKNPLRTVLRAEGLMKRSYPIGGAEGMVWSDSIPLKDDPKKASHVDLPDIAQQVEDPLAITLNGIERETVILSMQTGEPS